MSRKDKSRIVIFDMDGTLIDSATDITITINHIRSLKHLEPVESRQVVEAINSGRTNLAEFFYGTKTYEKRDRDLFETHYWDQCIQNVTVYPGVRELLTQLQANDVRLAVATNAATIFARKMLKHVGIHGFFEQILGSCDVKESKPHPEMIHKILRRFRFDTENYHVPAIVGDSHKDIGAAQQAKIHMIYARWGFPNDDVKDVTSARSPQEVPSILERL